MNIDSDLASDLERAIPHLSTAPPTAYLTSGRRALHRRRAYAGAIGLAVLALTGGAVLSVVDDPPSTTVSSGPSASPSAADIPEWAEEHGSHGPAAIAPNGDLWIAPDARLIHRVDNPLDTNAGRAGDITISYAIEAEMDGKVQWVFLYRRDGNDTGILDYKGAWTNDFDLWLDDSTAPVQGRPGLGARMVKFAGGSSELVARPGATIVRQIPDVALLNSGEKPRNTVAEVAYKGMSWFVHAKGYADGSTAYNPYETAVVLEPGLTGFVDFLIAPVDR